MTQIGVKGVPETGWIDQIDFFELDALDPRLVSSFGRKKIEGRLLPHQKITLSFGHFFLRGSDSTDRRERARLALEKFQQHGAQSSSILVPPSLQSSPELYESLKYFRDEFKNQKLPPPRVDTSCGKELPLERVGDPVWGNTKDEYLTKEWRIHGHHATRWVRLYSKEALVDLSQKTKLHLPERIIFAHSQRFLQAVEFSALLNKNLPNLRMTQ